MVLKQVYPLPWSPVVGFYLLNHPLKKKLDVNIIHSKWKKNRISGKTINIH
jgi:hypothetical protein